MQDYLDETGKKDAIEELHDIVERMLEAAGFQYSRPKGNVFGRVPPIDFSKPNQHNNKSEFQNEMDAVATGLDQLNALIGMMADQLEGNEFPETSAKFRTAIDVKMLQAAPRQDLQVSLGLVRKNVAEIGGFMATAFILADLQKAFKERHFELLNQQEEFWSLSHRPPNHYARAIALRLARFYAKETRQRPTIGTSGDTGDPSTAFARALKEMFDLLGIKSTVRSPAEWAIGQLTDEDVEPAINHLRNLGIRMGQ